MSTGNANGLTPSPILHAQSIENLDLLRINCNQGVSNGDSSQISRFIGKSSSHSASLESYDAISRCIVTPEGHRHYVPTCVDDSSKPVVNQVFDSLEKGMTFYMEYGQLCGFDTCRSTKNKDDDDITILTKYVVCGRAGFKEKKKNQGLRLVLVEFVGGQFLKVRDFRNFSRDLKAYVGERDAQMIVDKFKVKHGSCECSYYAYDVDAEGHLTKLFWADSIARRNYELYGDVVSFDATFDTNMYFYVKLGNFLCKETDLMVKMKNYIWSSTLEPSEFESGWKSVLKEFKLEGHKWLWEMYAIKKSWIPAFFRDKPMFGLLRTTSRSESENNFFGQFHRQSDSLCEFYLRFESAMDKQP
ncbi:hypothetical protein POM88_045493 [Heracleum sosnowskyi]|uniref:FAR1 domain-containing protein n=1 Tax=Heracleum sosnowskyi TaxID=360622 RepID=A0AAD8H7D7_9APIA|nr:hypothetical protein POM88_045493 [Heracleum sosnowskyi]